MLLDLVIDALVNLSYLAIPLAILVGSLGIPIPEEITLLIAGYLASIEFFDLKYAMILSFASMVAGDNLSYFLGYKGSHIVDWMLSKARLNWAKDKFKEHPYKTIFFSRFFSGLRVFFPIAAGYIKLPWKKFFIVDLFAVLILVPVFTLLGFYLAPQFDSIIIFITRMDKVVVNVIAGLLVVSFLGVSFF